MPDEKMTRVKATSEMDAETFRKHMNARHTPLGGMNKIGKSNIPGDENEDILRHYHDRAHELGLDSIGRGQTREITHYHSDHPPKETE